MNAVDSCGWLEFLADGPNAAFFEPALTDEDHPVVPAITLFEVARVLIRQRGPAAAETALGFMVRGRVLAPNLAGSLRAARSAVQHQLAMADALIWQAATDHGAVLWTQDAGLAAVPGVRHQRRPG